MQVSGRNIPSAEEMEKELSNEPVTQAAATPLPQTQAPATPANNQAQAPSPSNLQLASSGEEQSAAQEATSMAEDYLVKAKKWFLKLLGVALILQGLHGIYKSVVFIFVDYPLLEQQLSAHLISQDQINDFAVKAVIMIFSTVMSLFFAMKLTILQSKAAKGLQTVIAILLVIGNAAIHDYFVELNTSKHIVDVTLWLFNFLRNLPGKILNSNQYVEQVDDGSLEAVWYK